jgi:hypothetical protein
VTETARSRLRATRRAAPQRPAWHPPGITDFAWERRVMAFDASLANVGWVVMIIQGGAPVIEGHGTIRPRQDDDGYMGTWQRARDLHRQLWGQGLVLRYMYDDDVLKAVEAPVVGAGHRKESSLIAGMMVWMESSPIEVISATHVSAVLLGDARIRSGERKPAVKKAVAALVPEAAGRGWNEHERDSLSIGFTALWDLKQQEIAGGV